MTRHRWELLTAAELMKTDIVSVSPTSTLTEIETILVEKGISGVAVRDASDRIIGVISWRDVMDADVAHAGGKKNEEHAFFAVGDLFGAPERRPTARPSTMRAREIMSQHILTVPKSAEMSDIAGMMSEYRVHRLFVTDEAQRIVGIVSTLDLMDALSA